MSFVQGLQCRECGQEYPQEPLHVCDNCFGPLEIQYDYDGIKKAISREKIAAREDRKSTRLNSSHIQKSRMPSSA